MGQTITTYQDQTTVIVNGFSIFYFLSRIQLQCPALPRWNPGISSCRDLGWTPVPSESKCFYPVRCRINCILPKKDTLGKYWVENNFLLHWPIPIDSPPFILQGNVLHYWVRAENQRKLKDWLHTEIRGALWSPGNASSVASEQSNAHPGPSDGQGPEESGIGVHRLEADPTASAETVALPGGDQWTENIDRRREYQI